MLTEESKAVCSYEVIGSELREATCIELGLPVGDQNALQAK
jgi:hypothetical protein